MAKGKKRTYISKEVLKLKKITVLLMVLALVMLMGVSQKADAHSNLLQAVKVGGGWVSVVSYINTQPAPAGGAVFIHATHQSKNPTNLLDACVHVDGRSITTLNDLTTTVISATGGGVGSVFPVGDTVGGALIAPAAMPAPGIAEGFLVLENFDSAGVLGVDGTLTSDAIVFNLASGFLFSERALTTTHTAASPGGNVVIDAPGCGTCNYLPATPFSAGAATVFGNTTAGTLTRFAFLPPVTAATGAYVIAFNRAGTAELVEAATSLNLVAPGYTARIRVEARMDAAQAYALGVYNRLEQNRSLTQTNDVVCLGQLSPAQLTGAAVPAFIVDGGWMNLAPRCVETEAAGVFTVCDGDALGTELGDAANIFKVETATGYGMAVTPHQQQWYTK